MSHHDLEQTGRTIRSIGKALRPPTRPGIVDIHGEANRIANGGKDADEDDPEEFVVTLEVSDVLIVRAASVEDAVAKAVTRNPVGSDFDIETVSHNVHACVHTGPQEEGDGEE